MRAQTESRTRDLRITSALLYQLSYLGNNRFPRDSATKMLSARRTVDASTFCEGSGSAGQANGFRPLHDPVAPYGWKRANSSSEYQSPSRVSAITCWCRGMA